MNRSPIAGAYADAVTFQTAAGGAWELAAWFRAAADHGPAVEREYAAVAGRTALIDRSWLSRIRLTGADARAFLQGMLTQDVAGLADGESCHACLLDATAHLIADLRVHARPDCLLLETDPRCAGPLLAILDRYLITEDVEIDDVTAEYAVLAVGGEPGVTLPDGAFTVHGEIGGRHAREIWAPIATAQALWSELAAAGLRPVGLEAEEIHRIEAGIPAWGSELDPTILFPETGMADAVSYTKGCYIGQEIVARVDARGHANRSLRLIDFGGAAVAAGDLVYAVDDPGREIGRLTSAARSIGQGRWLALGYVRREHASPGSAVAVRRGGDPVATGIVA